MNYHLSKSNDLLSFKEFNIILQEKRDLLCEFKENIECIVPFKVSFVKLVQIGHVMKTFYELYDRKDYHEAILFSFGFNGYFENICGLKHHLDCRKMNFTIFVNNKKQSPKFKNMYYAKFVDLDENENENCKQSIVKNHCNLKKNIIITGPNASGKTTSLKTTLLNILLSQQIGAGCFEKCIMHPYSKMHCYLNIPDTSGRDSLFQAEARRCKEIIESISKPNSQETHFCIFDELYSGTNPEEAVVSAKAFMEYLVNHDNVACMLTTHYTKLCKKLQKNHRIQNYHMETIKEEGDCNFRYTYLMKKGMSNVKGGLKVLKDMDYPKEIIDKTSENMV
jgi:DNA mismatch repair ATPase MutS